MLAQIRGQRKRDTHVIGCKTPDREKKLSVIEKKNYNLQYHHELPCYNVLGECVQVFLHGFKYVVQRSTWHFLSISQLCSVVVIALILLVLLFIAPLFFHLPKVRGIFAKIIPGRSRCVLFSFIWFGAKFQDVTEWHASSPFLGRGQRE